MHNLFWTASQKKDWTLEGISFSQTETLKVLSPGFTILLISKEQVLTVQLSSADKDQNFLYEVVTFSQKLSRDERG
jgi:hypothetical protein